MAESRKRVYETIDLGNILVLKDLLNKIIASRDRTILIIGLCRIDYRGRAYSEADYGIRLVILKPDGTLLIHESEGRDPLNWQPPGSTCAFYTQENMLLLKCIRPRPKEFVDVYFKEIYHIGVALIEKSRFFEVKGVERDLVELVVRRGLIIDTEAKLVGREISTPHGKIDLVFRNISSRKLYVVEVKNEKAGVPAVDQLKRYVEYMREHARGEEIIGVLIARGVSDEALKILGREGFIYIDSSDFSRYIGRDRDLTYFSTS